MVVALMVGGGSRHMRAENKGDGLEKTGVAQLSLAAETVGGDIAETPDGLTTQLVIGGGLSEKEQRVDAAVLDD